MRNQFKSSSRTAKLTPQVLIPDVEEPLIGHPSRQEMKNGSPFAEKKAAKEAAH
jgi:hypothetical protein